MGSPSHQANVLLTGCTGMLGNAVMRALLPHHELSVLGVARTAAAETLRAGAETRPLDLTTGLESLANQRFDWIIHTAANVNVDGCERDPEGARRLHVDATAALVRQFPGARFVYLSTDAVFDGKNPPYRETSATNPLNHYAVTKLAGEQAAAMAAAWHVIRMSIFGFHMPELKSSLAEWALKSWAAGRATPGYEDISFNPLYCGTLAEVICAAIRRQQPLPEGIVHLGCRGSLTKFHFLRLLARATGYGEELVVPSRFADLAPGVRANRPANITLALDKAESHGITAPTIEREIELLAADLKSNKISFYENR